MRPAFGLPRHRPGRVPSPGTQRNTKPRLDRQVAKGSLRSWIDKLIARHRAEGNQGLVAGPVVCTPARVIQDGRKHERGFGNTRAVPPWGILPAEPFDPGRKSWIASGSLREPHDRRKTMQASVGDRLVIKGHHVGEPDRDAEILEVHGTDGGPPYLVRWSDDGHEGLFFPSTDASIEHFPHKKARKRAP